MKEYYNKLRIKKKEYLKIIIKRLVTKHFNFISCDFIFFKLLIYIYILNIYFWKFQKFYKFVECDL